MPELLRNMSTGLMDWLCPGRCAACDEPLGPGQALFCEVCASSLVLLEGPRCPRCGARLARGGCVECRRASSLFEMARSLYSYGGALAQVIQRYKYGSRLDLARPLGVLLAKALGEPHSVFSSGALVVPVPSSQMALGRRGFDPVMEILRTIDGLRWAPLLVRVDRREAQAALEGRERRSLGPEAFRPRGKGPVGEPPLVLVDDVLTTGATVRAAARALMALGARAIGVVTLARAEELPPGPSGVEVVLASSP